MRTLFIALAAAVLLASPASAFEIHAHRGGTVSNGKPAYPEESLDAYRHAAANGFALEVDAKLTKDGVPVAIHDPTVDRTTTCTGQVRTFTLRALRACRPDVLGSPGGARSRKAKPRGRVATIAEVLELARITGARVNLEIKNLPTDPDWDPTPGYANRVMDVVEAAGLSRSQLLIQSFIPANLDVAKQRIRRVATSFLTFNAIESTIKTATDGGYDWLSPQWPVPGSDVMAAQRAGLRVIPYTLDKPAEVRAARRARVDGLITDDPLMAARTMGLRPARGLTAKLARHPALVQAHGKLRLPRGVSQRRGCRGRVTLRVLGAKRALSTKRTALRRDCTYSVALTVPRGAPAELLATIGFAGNSKVLPRLAGPKSVPPELPRAVPHD